MKADKQKKKNGGILLMAMLVVLAFSILAIGLFKLFDTDALETVSLEHHRRAFWMAEMGLEKVVDRLYVDLEFRNNPNLSDYTDVEYNGGSFGNGSYTIESIDINPAGSTGLVYTVTARGMAGSMNRRIQQDIFSVAGSPHAIRSTGGNVDIDSNVDIEGDVFVDVGDVDFASNTEVDGIVVAGGDVSGNGASGITIIEMPPPPKPSIDTDFWAQFTDGMALDLNPNTNGLAGITTVDIVTGVSNYVYSTTMQSSKNLVISGSGGGISNFHYLVSATGIQFNNWLTLMPQTVIMVHGNIVIDHKYMAYENCIIYATGSISVKQSSETGSYGVTLIAEGDIEMAQQILFNGIIFAEGSVDIGSYAKITGTILAGDDIKIRSNAELTFNPEVFLNPLPGLNNIWNQAIFAPGEWREIAPAY